MEMNYETLVTVKSLNLSIISHCQVWVMLSVDEDRVSTQNKHDTYGVCGL